MPTAMPSLNPDNLKLADGSNDSLRLSRVKSALRAGNARFGTAKLFALVAMCVVAMTGCGSGGYTGGGIVSLSASSATIDAGQSFSVSSKLSSGLPVSWSLTGSTCTTSGCGAVSTSTGDSTVYTAPATVASPIQLTLTAAVTGTKSSSAVSITVNPAPSISSTALPGGSAGVAYTTTLSATGGTAPLKWGIASGSLPAGLTLNAATGVISGTPTTAGSANVTVEVTDSSDIPDTVTLAEKIQITAGGTTTLAISGNPPAGTVGAAYTATLQAAGGTSPYTWSILNGALPAGLTLGASSGIISGTPTAQGTDGFTVQVQDTTGDMGNSSFTVTINAAQSVAYLTLAPPPNATNGAPYSGTVGVSGGAAPYTCVITGLPAGLTANNCTISGTPTTTGTTTITVKASDSGNPASTTTGTVPITVNPASLSLTLSSLPNATVGTPYTATIGVTGGTAPYACAITGGALPAGLSLTGCVVSGTPTTAGTANLTVKATDSSNPVESATGPVSLTVSPAPLGLTLSSLPNATVGTPYTATIGVTGGTAPYACAITGGTLPAGLSLSGCVVSGTPTTAGTANLTVRATDSSNPVASVTGPVGLTVDPAAVTLTLTAPPSATAGSPYSGTVGVSGGTAPYTCVITGLPAGLTANNCAISGTPTTPGTTTVTVKATDSSNPTATKTGTVPLTVNSAALSLTLSSLPNGTAGVPYTATIGVAGGTSPYSCAITGGTLPAGLSLSGCVVSGTPAAPGTANLTVRATDSSSPTASVSGPVSLTINPAPLSLTLSSLPNATAGVPYTATIGVSGGTSPYACAVTGGVLPAGLSLSGCIVSGTPTTAGTANLTVKATDSSSPAGSVTGPVSLTVNPAPLSLTLSSLPNGTVGVPYNATVGVAGGTSPYSCAIISGTLPAGLSLSGCVVSGTPTTSGTANLTVRATDSSSPAGSVTGPLSLTVNPAPLSLTLSSLPNATVGTAYTATIGVAGGTAPYSCAITGGTLPGGLSLSGCVVSGTPTVAGAVALTVKATDSGSPVETVTGPVGLTVLPAAVTLSITSPPNATVGVAYSGIIGVSGGTGPYTCTITGGTLPAGLTASGCAISGTPSAPGTANLTVRATDSSSPAATTTGPVTLTVSPASVLLTLTSPLNGTVGTPYTGSIGVSGGTAPYTCTITGGALPAGLTATGCSISGTPTTEGTANFTVHATDSNSPAAAVTQALSLTISPVPTLILTGSLPNAILNQPYTQTLTATGGIPPYTYSITVGAPPSGITLIPTGVVSGTPTAVGASSFTVQVTDSESTPQTATLPLVLQVVYPTTPNDSELVGPYAFLFQGYDDVVAGVLSYQTATAGSFTADGTGIVSAGEMDSNHQGSNPTGNTVSSNIFLGTYTIGTDNRGFLTLTNLNSDGTTGTTATYAISLKAPTAPSTVSTQADMIEFDSDNLVGTRGSGTLLAQQGNFAAGLNGSYVFGMSGDTPCLPTCTLGVIAGPAASVGQFTASGLTVTGTGDSNIATTTYPSEVLTGSYVAADANGRVGLTLNTANTPAGVYPGDYAVYTVSPSQAFIVSTDKHSSFVLLAGSAQLQTQASFDNTSMSGAFIGYENAATDPNLVTGLVLQNVLNLSTATIFRGTATADGNCNITNYDQGGLTGLVNGVTGLLSSITLGILQGLLGPPATIGPLTCGVSSNGRGTLQYPVPNVLGIPTGPAPLPRVFYLSAPGQGYFLESGYAGLGNLEPQVPPAGGFVPATFNGTFVYASSTAASLASINASGFIVANGTAQTATATLDENIGIGTINVLELGPANGTPAILGINLAGPPTPAPFHPTDPVAGRYMFGTDVIYAINPNRFVLMDMNALTTSPSITLLY